MILSDSLRRQYLAAMGIQVWERRILQPACPRPGDAQSLGLPSEGVPCGDIQAPSPQPPTNVGQPAVSGMDWETLEQVVSGCTKCGLHRGRTHTVFGTGNRHAKWMFIGEAPGSEEDRQGEPFVGRAGQLLNAMLFATGLRREEVYIANVLKCRPPNNRDPQPDEVRHCEPYLVRQIEFIQPRMIVALGRHAAHSLLRTELALGKLRGQQLHYHGIPLIVTYHPAYLLRSPADKRKAWEDLCLARRLMEAAP